jgi:hypothetical protein
MKIIVKNSLEISFFDRMKYGLSDCGDVQQLPPIQTCFESESGTTIPVIKS